MPGLIKNQYGDQPPEGVVNFLRSTQPGSYLTKSATIAASSHPVEPTTTRKLLQKGELIAKITSGPDTGQFGVYSTDTSGVTDGRSDVANIVGINNSYTPWQLNERDVEAAIVYAGSVNQAYVTARDAAGNRVAVINGTVTTLQARKDLNLIWN